MAILLWAMTLVTLGRTQAASYLDKESRGERYRVSHFGRQFLLAIPDNRMPASTYSWILGVTCFTPHKAATVTLLTPAFHWAISKPTYYRKKTFTISYDKPHTQAVSRRERVRKSMTGWAMRISADQSISVQVHYIYIHSDTYMLPPLESYARRYAIYNLPMVSLLLTLASHDDTNVRIKFSGQRHRFKVKCSWNAWCGTDRTAVIRLNGSTYSFITTEWQLMWSPHVQQSLTGTSVVADKPVLVILGNRYRRYRRFSISPVIPVHMWRSGYFCVLNNIDKTGADFSLGVSSFQKTSCWVMAAGSKSITFQLKSYTGHKHLFTAFRQVPQYKPWLMKCRHRVQVITYSESNSLVTSFQFPLVSNAFWPRYVQFRPFSLFRSIQWRLHLFAYSKDINALRFNGRSMKTHHWKVVYSNFRYVRIPVTPSKYVTITAVDGVASFVAYATASDTRYHRYLWRSHAVGTPLGYFYQFPEDERKHPCQPDLENMKPGDLIDNDCDGRFDEEVPTQRDSDKDKRFNEDSRMEIVDGHWGRWTAWYCTAKCRGRGIWRKTRVCDNPPPLNYGTPCPGGASAHARTCSRPRTETCPKRCLSGFFRLQCDALCPKACVGFQCDRLSGTCPFCDNGYEATSPYCDRNEYTGLSLEIFERLIQDDEDQVDGGRMLWLVPLGLLVVVVLVIVSIEGTTRTLKTKKTTKKKTKKDEDLRTTNDEDLRTNTDDNAKEEERSQGSTGV